MVTCLRATPKVDNFGFVDFSGFGKVLEELFVNLVLAVLHVAQLFHQLSEDIFVCENAAFGDFYLCGVTQACLLHFLYPGEYCVNLEGEAPAFGLCVISLQHVDPFTSQILPILHRLLDPNGLGHSRS